jgi:UDP-N-acetylmuramoylalanine--D-glutamate ligase
VTRLKDQHVLILGLGSSGLAMARWCTRLGARVTVADTRINPPQLATLRTEIPQARFVHTALDASLLEGGVRAVFKSPGLSPTDVAGVVDMAQQIGLWVGSELGLFSQGLSDLKEEQNYTPCVLAVTGSNGKTTVTALTALLVERAGKRVCMAGNIGPTLLDSLANCLDNNTLPEVWVLELSSFQLDAERHFEPAAATVLNISQDHLDWHGSMAHYQAAKARIFGPATLRILNREDLLVMAMQAPVQAHGKGKPHQAPEQPKPITFGADMPKQPGDYGIEHVNGMAWLVRVQEADASRKRKRGEVSEEDNELFIQRLMPADALRIRGRHNATNALAALALAQAGGCSLGPMLFGLREYRGEPHRLESVGVMDGVEYFDDSKGTNVGATVAAISSLGEDGAATALPGKPPKVVVILGGVGKGQDFSALLAPVARYARAVVLIGQDAPAIHSALQTSGVPVLAASSMAQAVALAQTHASPGDAVLMSPACASFDMFDNYAHRAQVFCDAVQALMHDSGQLAEGLA